MTTDLERDFFETFKITPTVYDGCHIEDFYFNNSKELNKGKNGS